MWQKQPLTKFWGSCSAKSTWLAWTNQLAAKVRVRFMVMLWSEGGQVEARGACAPHPPLPPQIAPPGPPPPNRPSRTPPLQSPSQNPPSQTPPPPPGGLQPMVSWRPGPRSQPPPAPPGPWLSSYTTKATASPHTHVQSLCTRTSCPIICSQRSVAKLCDEGWHVIGRTHRCCLGLPESTFLLTFRVGDQANNIKNREMPKKV